MMDYDLSGPDTQIITLVCVASKCAVVSFMCALVAVSKK